MTLLDVDKTDKTLIIVHRLRPAGNSTPIHADPDERVRWLTHAQGLESSIPQDGNVLLVGHYSRYLIDKHPEITGTTSRRELRPGTDWQTL